MSHSLKVGIIGANAERGWAKESHVPAVQKLAGIELAAVATNSQQSADAAATKFGVKAYASAKELISDQAIDIVTVAVGVPKHRDLVLGALAAGKHVYCEWPLGRDLAEAQELEAIALAAGVKVALGLQTRTNAAMRQARNLIFSTKIGRVLCARMLSETVAFGAKADKASLSLEDETNGATLISIHGGHAVDTAIAVLGEFENVQAMTSIQFPEVEVSGTGDQHARTIPDHMLTVSSLSLGAALSIEVSGGRAHPIFTFQIVGESGSLMLQGGAARGFQSGRLELFLNGTKQILDEGEISDMPDTAVNVAGIYAQLRDDIRNGTTEAPDFGHAVHLTRIIDDLVVAARKGKRQQASDWPTL